MGWLFGRKKKIPPQTQQGGQAFDEKALRFPTSSHSAKVIKPEEITEAAGFKKPIASPEVSEEQKAEGMPQNIQQQREPQQERHFTHEPLFIKMNVYQRVLGELDELKHNISQLHEANRHLETSEFNEENNFEKLKKLMRNIHDRILIADKVLFKSQGE